MAEPEPEQTLEDEGSERERAMSPTAPTDTLPSKTVPPKNAEPEPEGPDLPTVPRAVYEAGEEIARGGLGRIYRARDLRLDRVVAIKELLHPTPANQRRFLREIEVTVGLEHPNIVSIHEAGRWPDAQPFYSMNFVRGSTLLEAMQGCETLEQRLKLLPFVINVAEAVAYAHDKGVTHRDLKPANVLVGRFGETVVIDWGLAKHTRDRDASAQPEPAATGHTRFGAVVGTPPYMPPEQARGEVVDTSADVYALGAMLYQLVSGRAPFFDVGQERLIEAIQSDTPVPLARLVPDLPPDLLAIVEKAMAPKRDARYPAAREMVEELRSFSAGRLVGAYSYSIADLLLRFAKKHMGALLTATVAILLLIALASYGVSTISGERDTAQRHAAEAEVARDRAEARSRALVVAEARALTDSDPTAAVARLKRLTAPTRGAISVAARAQELGVAEAVLTGAGNQLACAAFSPDGRHVAAAGENQDVLLWSLFEPGVSKPFGPAEPRRLEGHSDRISDCVFSSDGQKLASTGYDGQIIVWSLNDGTQRLLSSPGGTMRALRFSDDGSRLAGASAEGTTRQWWLDTDVHRDLGGRATRKPVLRYDGNGQGLLAGPSDGRLRLWTPSPGNDGTLLEAPQPISAVTAARPIDGARVLVGTEAGLLYQWEPDTQQVVELANVESAISDLDTGQRGDDFLAAVGTMNGDVYVLDVERRSIERLTRHAERVAGVRMDRSGRLVASAGWDQLVRIVDIETRAVRVLRGHRDVVSTVAFSPDGKRLLSGSWDNTLRVWPVDDDLYSGRKVLRGHSVGIHGARFSPAGRHVASGGHDDTVRLWSVDGGLEAVFEGHTDHVYRVIYSHDGEWVASSSDDMTVRLWSTRGDERRVFHGHQADVEEIAFSPDDRWLLSGSEDSTARLWEVASGQSRVLSHERAVTNVAFSEAGDRFATASRSGRVRIYDQFEADDGEPVPEAVFSHDDEVWAIAFGTHGSWFASADLSGTLEARLLGSGRVVSLGPVPRATLLRFSPDDRWIGVASRDGKLWVCEPARSECRKLHSGKSAIHTLMFTPDSRLLFAAGGDALLYGWDMETSEHRIYQGHRAPIFDLDIEPDGGRVVTASADETLRLWPVLGLPRAETFPAFLAQLTRLEAERAEADPIPKPIE